MPTDKPTGYDAGQRRCPVCWTWFTPNSPHNPHPRRYCCGACRIEDSRRRRAREEVTLIFDHDLGRFRGPTNDAERYGEKENPMNRD